MGDGVLGRGGSGMGAWWQCWIISQVCRSVLWFCGAAEAGDIAWVSQEQVHQAGHWALGTGQQHQQPAAALVYELLCCLYMHVHDALWWQGRYIPLRCNGLMPVTAAV